MILALIVGIGIGGVTVHFCMRSVSKPHEIEPTWWDL